MSSLQRSSVSFRRQGSSGRIWDDPLQSLDLKSLSAPTTPTAAPPLHDDDPFSLRAAEPSSARSWRGRAPSVGAIAESPDAAGSADQAPVDSDDVVHGGADGGDARNKRRRRRLSSAFCACMGHPPASHAQQ
jgi:hypothetical protein